MSLDYKWACPRGSLSTNGLRVTIANHLYSSVSAACQFFTSIRPYFRAVLIGTGRWTAVPRCSFVSSVLSNGMEEKQRRNAHYEVKGEEVDDDEEQKKKGIRRCSLRGVLIFFWLLCSWSALYTILILIPRYYYYHYYDYGTECMGLYCYSPSWGQVGVIFGDG